MASHGYRKPFRGSGWISYLSGFSFPADVPLTGPTSDLPRRNAGPGSWVCINADFAVHIAELRETALEAMCSSVVQDWDCVRMLPDQCERLGHASASARIAEICDISANIKALLLMDRQKVRLEIPETRIEIARALKALRNVIRLRVRQGRAKPKAQTRQAKPGFVYIAYDGDCHKIGMSKKPESRIMSLATSSKANIVMLGTMPVVDMRMTEIWLHSKMKEYHINREWFALPDRKAQAIVRLFKIVSRRAV